MADTDVKPKVYFTRFTEEQYLNYAKDLVDKGEEYRKQFFRSAKITAISGVFGVGFFNDYPIVQAFFVIMVVGYILLGVWSFQQLENDANYRVAYQLRENGEMTENNNHMRDRINIVAASGSMVLVGSQARDLIMNIAGDDNELKDAMAKISAAIEKLGNKEAADSWKDFLEEAAGKKSKSKLKAFWDRTISLAPDIATLTTAVAKVATLMI